MCIRDSLKNIPNELYESASIDGARFFTKLFRITIPLFTPILLFNLLLALSLIHISFCLVVSDITPPPCVLLVFIIYLSLIHIYSSSQVKVRGSEPPASAGVFCHSAALSS